MKQPIISFKNFTFQYDAQTEPTLHNINLDIFQGEKILVVGSSGSGKSTLANCMNGLVPFSYKGEIKGSLIIDGKESVNSSIFELAKSVGTVLQDSDSQFLALTAGEDIAFALENDCVEQEEMMRLVKETATIVSAMDLLESAPHELSGGQKQQIGLAGVMVDDVNILLLDEPLANLDPATGKKTIELIEYIQKVKGTTVIIIEHRLEDVLWGHVDRVILIGEGKILADLSSKDLLGTELLETNGIREPLYITALKYAGIQLTNNMEAQNIQTLKLDTVSQNKMRQWFQNTKVTNQVSYQQKIVEIKNLSYEYHNSNKVLNKINLTICKGEMISIVGKNGAGKSTLAKLICGFEKPSVGEIFLNEEPTINLSIGEIARQVGYIMQNPNQMISKTMIYEEVALGLTNSNLTEIEKQQQIDKTLKICGLYQFRNWPISALSFGQKKRVTIASVLVLNPSILILDEPTAGQDFKHYTEIMDFLSILNQQGVTIILITHDMHLMLEYTKRAIVFSQGELVGDTTSAKVLCDALIIEKASLKETSLFHLANICQIENPSDFVDRFINYDREVRKYGK